MFRVEAGVQSMGWQPINHYATRADAEAAGRTVGEEYLDVYAVRIVDDATGAHLATWCPFCTGWHAGISDPCPDRDTAVAAA